MTPLIEKIDGPADLRDLNDESTYISWLVPLAAFLPVAALRVHDWSQDPLRICGDPECLKLVTRATPPAHGAEVGGVHWLADQSNSILSCYHPSPFANRVLLPRSV